MLRSYPLPKSGRHSAYQHSSYDIVATPVCQEFFLIFSKNFLLPNLVPPDVEQKGTFQDLLAEGWLLKYL